MAITMPRSTDRSTSAQPREFRYRYDIHGIISVVSETRMPELSPFRVVAPIDRPTIRVRIDAQALKRPIAALDGQRSVRYADMASGRGFSIDILFGDPIDVVASPLLAKSPHVLYTNVVEPILRWQFVQQGYALVHGACLARGEDAFIITARTDTGKTTTCLRLLDNFPDWSFISDDLTIVSPNGDVMTYPKPLTISKHTLVAVQTPRLSKKERFTLVFQARLHSKGGRRFGLLLARTGLPMATTNAITQALVPPPKYPVQRLVPGVEVATRAKLAGMVVIERGPDSQRMLPPAEALDVLMNNSDDAYGFPPYDDIKETLYKIGNRDLRLEERATVEAALAGLPAMLLRSEHRNWWQQLPAFVGEALETGRRIVAPIDANAVGAPKYGYSQAD